MVSILFGCTFKDNCKQDNNYYFVSDNKVCNARMYVVFFNKSRNGGGARHYTYAFQSPSKLSLRLNVGVLLYLKVNYYINNDPVTMSRILLTKWVSPCYRNNHFIPTVFWNNNLQQLGLLLSIRNYSWMMWSVKAGGIFVIKTGRRLYLKWGKT